MAMFEVCRLGESFVERGWCSLEGVRFEVPVVDELLELALEVSEIVEVGSKQALRRRRK